MPRICWHTILTCGKPQWYGKPLKQRGLLSRQGEHSSRYWCQQDSVFARTLSAQCRSVRRSDDRVQTALWAGHPGSGAATARLDQCDSKSNREWIAQQITEAFPWD